MLFVSITSGHKASLYEEEITFVISLFGKILNKVYSKILKRPVSPVQATDTSPHFADWDDSSTVLLDEVIT